MTIEELEDQIAVPFPVRTKPQGTRMLAPTGEIGYVPDDQLEQALEDGATVLTPEKMRDIRQATFMQHQLFEEKRSRGRNTKRKRRSIVRGGRR